MAYYFRKKLKKKYYLFKGESVYKNGTSVRTTSKYVGPYEELSEYFQHSEVSILHQQHFEYGLSRALHELAKQLGLAQIFQHHITKKGKDSFLAKRILIMVVNRLIWPCAKYSIEKWYSKSDLYNILDMPSTELASQKIYRAMDQLDKYSPHIETAICKVIAAQENISFKTLYLDCTNQETYSRNHDSSVLKNGHNKRGHTELYQINISLCCDAVTGIPFFHRTYPGNFNDKQFIQLYAKELRERLETIGWKERNTLVIDRGINGKDNFGLLREYKFDYVGGLIESEFPEYFAIPKTALRKMYAHKRETRPSLHVTYTVRNEQVYGQEHMVIIVHNQENYDEKIQQLERDLEEYSRKCEQKLNEFKKEIAEKTFQSAWNNTDKIRNALKDLNKKLFPLFTFDIKSYRFELTWNLKINKKVYGQFIGKFGRYVLFTNRLDMKPKQVLDLFYNKDKIEKNFQYLKSNAYTNRFIVLGPMLHSKDARIESHVYTCIMALQLYQILRHRLKERRFQLSIQHALEELEEITCYYTRIAGKKEAIRHINSITDEQGRILNALQVGIFE